MLIKPTDIRWEGVSVAKVVSCAQKFVLPIGVLSGGGEPLVHPETRLALTDWEGKAVGDKGIVFFNCKDKAFQGVCGNGKGVIIFNEVNQAQAERLHAYVLAKTHDPLLLTLSDVKSVLAFASDELGLADFYPSDRGFITSKMTPLGEASSSACFGWHKRDDRDVCDAIVLTAETTGSFTFEGITQHEASGGKIVALRQPGASPFRGIQVDEFFRTYRTADGNAIDRSTFPSMSVDVLLVQRRLAQAVDAHDIVAMTSGLAQLRDVYSRLGQSESAAAIARLMYVHEGMVYDPAVQNAVVALATQATAGRAGPAAATERLGTVATPEGNVTVHLKHAADMVVMDLLGNVVLVKRGQNPGKGKWALPGGFIEDTSFGRIERASEAGLRELAEEAGLKVSSAPVHVGVWRINRPFDIRYANRDICNCATGDVDIREGDLINVTSQGFLVVVDDLSREGLNAGDDADGVCVMNIQDLYAAERQAPGCVLGIDDHWSIIVDAARALMDRQAGQIARDNQEITCER